MTYTFRGIIVFKYDPMTKGMTSPETDHGTNNFNFCSFIPEDYILISDFFRNAYLHSTGQMAIEDLKDIDVS